MSRSGVTLSGPTAREVLDQVVPLALYSSENGGLRASGRYLEAVTPRGKVSERVALPPDWASELSDYRICARFHDTIWCIGRPFQERIRFTVDWKQNGYECAGELLVPTLSSLPFSWDVVVTLDRALFRDVPNYVFDVAFPWHKLHDARDIVLRRRLVDTIRSVVCAGRGQFKVSKHDTWEVTVNNFFDRRPPLLNDPPIATCFPDIVTARARGRTRY